MRNSSSGGQRAGLGRDRADPDLIGGGCDVDRRNAGNRRSCGEAEDCSPSHVTLLLGYKESDFRFCLSTRLVPGEGNAMHHPPVTVVVVDRVVLRAAVVPEGE